MKDNIQRMEDYARDYDIPIMEPTGIAFIKNLIQENKIQTILEIGSAIGYSAIQMATVDPSIQITTIERDEERYALAMENIKMCQMEQRIDAVLADGLCYLPSSQFDLIFIDAAKSKYIDFFVRYAPFLNENGWIVSDNMEFHGMVQDPSTIKTRGTRKLVQRIAEYQTFLSNHDAFVTSFLAIGDGIAITRRRAVEMKLEEEK